MTDWFELGKLTEVPYLLAFIIFAVLLFKYFQRWSDAKDKVHIERMEKSEAAWRVFLIDQRNDFLKSISEITCAVADLRRKQEEHTEMLAQHDKKLDLAIAKMDARFEEHDLKIVNKRKPKAE
jgi:hypothetical protein